MRLHLNNGNQQNAYNKWLPGGMPYESWKNISNNKTVVASKRVKNDLPNDIKNYTNNCGFRANPIKHYRKQTINLNSNNSVNSNQSYIGGLDKPGGTNITSVECNILYQKDYEYILNLNNVTCNENCFIIKPASTIINTDYSVSNKELLRKKCKTFNQNLPLTSFNTNLVSYPDCSVINNCTPINNPSNTKYKVQGPISSSARIAAIKYCAQDVDSRRCYLPTTDYNRFGRTAHNKSSTSDTFNNLGIMPGCITCRSGSIGSKNKKYSNIRILK
tara:strand:- start:21465 stop:22286 length:822 start_codon:yes stop_codon:yes gene_type:complete